MEIDESLGISSYNAYMVKLFEHHSPPLVSVLPCDCLWLQFFKGLMNVER